MAAVTGVETDVIEIIIGEMSPEPRERLDGLEGFQRLASEELEIIHENIVAESGAATLQHSGHQALGKEASHVEFPSVDCKGKAPTRLAL